MNYSSLTGYTGNTTISLNPSELPLNCLQKGVYSLECIYREVCPQFNTHFLTIGLWIVGAFIIISWLKWWFFKYGYKMVKYDPDNSFLKFIGDLSILDNRLYWDNWIKDRFLKVYTLYIVMIIWLSWGF